MKEIPLTQGKVALVDDEDYERANQFKWHAQKDGRTYYVARKVYTPEGKRTIGLLHWFLLGIKRVDHRDGDGLNNQKGNLRPATVRQNSFGHRRKAVGKTSQYRGVSWCSEALQWRSGIKFHGQSFRLGNYETEEAAARAYDAAARKYFGEFASPNFS